MSMVFSFSPRRPKGDLAKPRRRLDPLTHEERSARMARVRGSGNKSTELAVARRLPALRIRWERHPPSIPGKPDFFFPDKKLALFVDGCFWHSCPRCSRQMPKSNSEFWKKKLTETKLRDKRTRGRLRRLGISTMRLWEHALGDGRWLLRLQTRLAK